MTEEERRSEVQDKTKGQEIRVPCPKCIARTRHVVRSSIDIHGSYQDWLQWWQHYQRIQCMGCEEVSFRLLEMNTEDVSYDDRGGAHLDEHEELYPPRAMGRGELRGAIFLPFEVRQVYEETRKALDNSQLILAGIGIRTLIEAVTKERGAKGKDLEKRIDDLVTQGVLTKDGASILHSLRGLGNAAAHEAKVYAEADLATAFDVVENLLQSVYILPAEASRLKEEA